MSRRRAVEYKHKALNSGFRINNHFFTGFENLSVGFLVVILIKQCRGDVRLEKTFEVAIVSTCR